VRGVSLFANLADLLIRYELVYREGDFDPAAEIINVVKDVSSLILATANRRPFLDPENGFVRKLQRSKHTQSMDGFKSALASYNTELDRLKESGAVSKSIAAMKSLPFELVERVLIQVYDRAVSPKVELLRKYENGTDFIYGELKPTFVFDVLTEAQMTSDQVFVDLGSGVANVVLQAALQVGCESWGCEMMENACDLAEIQKQEFEARCRLWGLSAGSIKLERGDFRTNSKLAGALKRADVILVNNEVFTPGLNNDLINMFLDLKDGCRIVSLKSFLPQNHKITAYNLNNPVNLLDVTEKSYSRNSVSWKEEGGHYYVAIKNSRRLESYSHLT
jgi:H3 lysine-79-specific histone-lysine N-methyltransferase